MISEKTKKWANAGIMLGNNPEAVVACRECGIDALKVKDIVIDGWDHFERIIYCEHCGARNFLLAQRDANES